MLNALYCVVLGAVGLTDEESERRIGSVAMHASPLIVISLLPIDVPWLNDQFESRRDAIWGSVFQSFPKLDTRSLAIELEWEAANVPAGKAGLAGEEAHALAMLDDDPAQPEGPLDMSLTKNDALKALSLHAQMCVHYGLMLARVLAGPKPGSPEACQKIIPLVKELNECLDLSSRLTSVRTGIFQFGTLAAPNACTAAFWLAHDVVGYVLPALALVSDGEMAAANWFFENWDNLAKSFRDHRDNFRFAVQDQEHFERLAAAEIVWETDKAAQGTGGKPGQSSSSGERKLSNLERLLESTKALTDLPGTLEALLEASKGVKEWGGGRDSQPAVILSLEATRLPSPWKTTKTPFCKPLSANLAWTAHPS